MKVYAIGDLHLSESVNKPMGVFGENWENHTDKIMSNWKSKIKNDDIILIPGDISWAMNLDEAMKDLDLIASMPGTKLLIKGNHDYWWKSIKKLNSLYESMIFIQNDSYNIGEHTICGTRGWTYSENTENHEHNKKIYIREAKRLKLSLDHATENGAKKIILMLHYPPTSDKDIETLFMEIIDQYPITHVIYGHLHGKDHFGNGIQGKYKGTKYILVSADYISFCPQQIFLTGGKNE